MGRICAVPKCKSGYRSCKERVSIFSIPKDKLESWKKIIPLTDRELTYKDSICEKHFRKKDVIRRIKTAVFEYDLQKPKLAPNAVPTKFPTCPKYKFRTRPVTQTVTRPATRPNHQNSLKNLNNGCCILSMNPDHIKFMIPKQRHKYLRKHEIDMKNKFMQKMQDRKKNSRRRSFTTSQCNEKIDEIVRGKLSKSTKYHRKRYEVVNVGGVKKLTTPFKTLAEVQFYIPDEELFDVIHEAHALLKHAKSIRMFKELRKTYINISRRDILMYLELCLDCSNKKAIDKFGSSNKLITCYNAFSSKCDINIIDYQPIPDGDYKFILAYHNDQTKFCMLKPLKSTTTDEIYYNICDIFTFIGVPEIINSDFCDETLDEVILKLKKRWPAFAIKQIKTEDHNKLTEKINEHVEAWMESKLSNKWSKGLRFIQLSINKDLNEDINKIPFEAVFDVCDEKKMALEEIENQKNYIKEEQICQEELIIKEEIVDICGTCNNDVGREESYCC